MQQCSWQLVSVDIISKFSVKSLEGSDSMIMVLHLLIILLSLLIIRS